MQSDHKLAASMRAYLLGQLSDQEAAELEEQYFVNRDCFLRMQSEENALIADYLADRLSKKERSSFESRYLHVPELERKVEEVRRQRSLLRPPSLPAFRVRWGMAAAALALALGFGFWARHYLKKQSGSSAQGPPAKQEPVTPVQPRQEPSAHEHEPMPQLIMPIEPSKNKPLADDPQRKNRPIPTIRSREDRFTADVHPLNQARRSNAATQAPVESAAINTGPTNGAGSAATTTVPPIKRVAVLDFDYGTVQSYVSSIYGSNQDVGKGITDMLVEKLVKDGKYSVIERKVVDKILAEQNFSNSDRANPAMAAKIGQILGVDAVIMGSITKFGRDDKSKSYGGLGVGPRAFGIGGIKKNESKAVCVISTRLVDANTGEILAAVTGEGESKRSGTSLIGGGGGDGAASIGGFDTHASNFSQTLLGEAVTQAISEIGSQFNADAIGPASRKAEASGFVTGVDGITLIVNIGSKAGLQIGDELNILRLTRTVQDPASGKVLRTPTLRLGIATVTEVDTESATATFKGTLPARVGDVAKTPN
jgi:curli biogenesis system outer membrane secretion channel CsgG